MTVPFVPQAGGPGQQVPPQARLRTPSYAVDILRSGERRAAQSLQNSPRETVKAEGSEESPLTLPPSPSAMLLLGLRCHALTIILINATLDAAASLVIAA